MFLLLYVNLLPAQQRNVYATDAFLMMRLVQKIHVQPRPMDDTFSVHFFDRFIESLDEECILFTGADMTQLLPYRTQMCDQVRMQRADFLQKTTTLFEQRLKRMDSLLVKLQQVPVQFSQVEYMHGADDRVYHPVNAEAQEKKLLARIKKSVLDYIVQYDEMNRQAPAARLRVLTDSLEPIARKKIIQAYQRSIKRLTQGAAGLIAAVGNQYCEALAATFDPHTTYLPRTEKENLESAIGSRSMRFGFSLEAGKDGVLIRELKPGSAAYKCGQLNVGDRFMSLQWENKEPIDVSEAGIEEVTAFLSQSNYGKLGITVRKADGVLRRIELQKESMETDDDENRVKSFLLKEGEKTIGYLSLPAFYTDWDNLQNNVKGCANDIAKEILRLRKENINGLILDLRYNGGGSMQEAIELSGIFIDAGPVGQVGTANGKVYSIKDGNRGTIYDGPLILLVNGASASASEMVAGTLQDYHRAVIMGTPTYGKQTGQLIMPLDTLAKTGATTRADGQRFIKITTEKLYRVTGLTAQREGVTPDIILPDLSEIYIKREKDNPSSLVVQPIDPNRFYTPNAGETLAGMVTKGRLLADTAAWSRNLKKNLAILKHKEEVTTWPLQLQSALSEKATMMELNKKMGEKIIASYTVHNTALEEQKLKLSPVLTEINQQWKTRLQLDTWVSVAFQVLGEAR